MLVSCQLLRGHILQLIIGVPGLVATGNVPQPVAASCSGVSCKLHTVPSPLLVLLCIQVCLLYRSQGCCEGLSDNSVPLAHNRL